MRASRVSASYGAQVAIAEAGRFGGTCVNVGCIPKKLFSYAAHFREDFEIARGFGWTVGEPRFDWPTLLANKDREIARLNGVYERVLAKAGVEIHRGARHGSRPALGRSGREDATPQSTSWSRPAPGRCCRRFPASSTRSRSNEAFHLERAAAARDRGRRRLHRARVRLDLPRPRRADHAHLPRQARCCAASTPSSARASPRRWRPRASTSASAASRRRSARKQRQPARSNSPTAALQRDRPGACSPPAGGRTPRSSASRAAGVKLAADGAVDRRPVLEDQCRFDPRHRRRHQPHQPHAGRHRRGDVARAHAVPRRADARSTTTTCRPRCSPIPNVATVGLSEEQARERFGAVDIYKTSFRALKLTLTRARRSAPS